MTISQLNDKFTSFRWEMRFLLLAATIGSHFVPVASYATTKAAHMIGLL